MTLTVHALIGTAIGGAVAKGGKRGFMRCLGVALTAMASHVCCDRLPHRHPDAIWDLLGFAIAICLASALGRRGRGNYYVIPGLFFAVLPDAPQILPGLVWRLTHQYHPGLNLFHPPSWRPWPLRVAPGLLQAGTALLAVVLLCIYAWRWRNLERKRLAETVEGRRRVIQGKR